MAQTPGFNLEDIRLPQLAVEVWKGFIFVNFSLDAVPLRLASTSWKQCWPTTTSTTSSPLSQR